MRPSRTWRGVLRGWRSSGRGTVLAVAVADHPRVGAEGREPRRGVGAGEPRHQRLHDQNRRRQQDQRALQLTQGCDEFGRGDLSPGAIA